MTSVPSFASFPNIEEDEAGPSSAPTQHRHEKPVSAKGKKAKHAKHRHDSETDHPKRARTTAVPTTPQDTESKLFYLDRRGDELNITYGSLHSRSVPKYHRQRGVLGLPPRWYPSDDFSNADRYIYKSNLVQLPQRLQIGSEADPRELDADFIPLAATGDELSPEGSPSRSPIPEGPSLLSGITREPRIKQDPSDVPAWHRLLRETASSSPTPKAAADIQLSILARALHNLPHEPSLLAARARISASFDIPSQADQYWEEALANAKGEGRGELWKEWLGWVFKSKGLDEGVSNVRRAMEACTSESGVVLVDLFTMACAILHNAGYTERAICAYQALLQVHFFPFPDLPDAPWQAVIRQLEVWWDKEHLRLGEGSQGSDLPGDALTTQSSTTQGMIGDAFSVWLEEERRTSRANSLPPPAGDQDDSDPYRVTVFLDIVPLLPTRRLSPSQASLVARDMLGLIGLGIRSSVATEVGQIKHIDAWVDMWDDQHGSPQSRQTFVRNVLSQLRPKMKDVDLELWDEISVAYEWSISRKSAVKFAKVLLSTSPSSLQLWSLYADMERLSNKPDSARKVYQTVLANQETTNKPAAMRMWLDWALLEWQEGATERSTEILCQSLLGGNGIGPVRLLKARQMLEGQFSSQPRPELLKARALLAYLTSSTLTETMSTLRLDRGADESLHLARAEFLKTLGEYRGVAPVPPTALRDTLEESAHLFPSNGRLLRIYAWNEKREKFWGRVRRLLETIISRQYDVHLETWAAAVNSDDSVSGKREWLDRAVQDDRMRSSVFLWKAYVDFEFEHGKPQKAKSLLYRAVAECPWSKDLHILALSPVVKTSFKAHELNAWMDVMLERSIRLRVEWTGQSDDEEEDDVGEEVNEMEAEVAERRRLMPY